VRNPGSRSLAWIVSLLLLAGASALGWLARDDGTKQETPPAVASAPPPVAPPASGGAPTTEGSPAPMPTPRAADAPRADPGGDDRGLERALRWASVDLDALRQEIPDNLYWEMGAPTDDPAVIEARAQERARWNEAWGQVLSGNASEEEIHAYFAHRQRLSTDYLEFASLLLDRHGDTLPERDVGLLELSVRMHHARLQSLPRDLAAALERKARQDALREAWRRDEARFAPDGDAAP
jgi:hypothetical protein